jgi:NAD(P)-dependent dehydrogenase (short-subunit alcohol dehydrogenase family)
MEGLLDGKVAVITGAGSGVGRAAAKIFSAHGAKLLCADINAAAVQETVAMVRAAGGDAESRICDVSDESSVTALTEATVARYARLDIMYNNAGIASPPSPNPRPGRTTATFLETTAEQMQRLQAVNIQGVIHGCRASIRVFQRQDGGGVIVNTASVAGLFGFGGACYAATKGAIVALTRSLAIEFAPQLIRVNSVCPAAMLTNFGSMSQMAGEALEYVNRMHPLGRTVDPADCANAALFLASDLARNITGVNLPVDAGISAGRS